MSLENLSEEGTSVIEENIIVNDNERGTQFNGCLIVLSNYPYSSILENVTPFTIHYLSILKPGLPGLH